MNRIQQSKRRRGAAVLLCVLACLSVVVALVLSLTRSTLQSQRETRIRMQMRQTEYLLDAGMIRAASQLRESVDYRGEQWRPTLERFDGALVLVQVAADPLDDEQRIVAVSAELGTDHEEAQAHSGRRTRRSRTITIFIDPSNSSDAE